MILGASPWIEWLEFSPVSIDWRGGKAIREDVTQELLAALREINAPTSIESSWVRVWGYLRPGVSPAWIIPQART